MDTYQKRKYPPFRKHCAREKFIEEIFSEGLREIVAIDCAKSLFGNYFRAIAHFVVALCFLTVFL